MPMIFVKIYAQKQPLIEINDLKRFFPDHRHFFFRIHTVIIQVTCNT
jgi:hypothetical protein